MPAHAAEVVAPGVEEELVDERAGVLVGGRIARADLAVELEEGLVLVHAGIVVATALAAAEGGGEVGEVALDIDFLEEGEDAVIGAEHLLALAAGSIAGLLGGGGAFLFEALLGGEVLGERGVVVVAGEEARLIDGADEHGDGQLALAVDLDAEDALGGGLELKPGAAAGDELGVGHALAALGIGLDGVVDAGGAHELADNDALGAVDDEGAAVGHQGEVAEEEALLLDLARVLDAQLDIDEEGRGEGHVAFAALLLVVLGLAELVLAKDEVHLGAGEVLDRRELIEQLAEALTLEPVEGIELELDEAGYLKHVRDGAERLDGEGGALALPRPIKCRGHVLATPSVHGF